MLFKQKNTKEFFALVFLYNSFASFLLQVKLQRLTAAATAAAAAEERRKKNCGAKICRCSVRLNEPLHL